MHNTMGYTGDKISDNLPPAYCSKPCSRGR